MSRLPASTLAQMRRVSVETMDGWLVASVATAAAGVEDDWGQVAPADGRDAVLSGPCSVLTDRARVEQLASGDARLQGADAVVVVERAGDDLLTAYPSEVLLAATYGPLDERVDRDGRLEGLRHGDVVTFLFVAWTSPERPTMTPALPPA